MANSNDNKRRQPEPSVKPLPPPSESKSQAAVWDCGSALYDSVELTSFQRRLDSAISSSRTLSMPHLSDRRLPAAATTDNNAKIKPAAGSKISRSLQKLLRSVFSHAKHKAANDVKAKYVAGEEFKRAGEDQKNPAEKEFKETRWIVLHEEKNDVVYKEEDVAAPAPATIRDSGKVSPGNRTVVGKSMSERFTAVSLTNVVK